MEGIEFSWWLFEGRLRQGKNVLPDRLNWLFYTVNNYRQVTGMVTGENFAFFIYRHFVEIL